MAIREYSLDEYRTVTATVVIVKDRAIQVEVNGGQKWLPRSLLHGGDDIKMGQLHKLPSEATFRLMEWKAEEVGLT
jgi:hypothetical protein